MYFFLIKILIISHISCILNRWNQVNGVNIKKNLILRFLSLDRRSKILKIKISAKSIERVKDSVNFLRWGRWQELPWKSHITNAFNSQTDDPFKDGANYCYCAYVLRICRYSDFLSPMLTNTGIFLCGLNLSWESRSWYPKRKLGVTMRFWEIIKLQFEKERHTLLCILKLFTDIIHELSLKNAWLPTIFFLDFNTTCQDLLFLHNHTPRKKYL